jgi:hypothetical protein
MNPLKPGPAIRRQLARIVNTGGLNAAPVILRWRDAAAPSGNPAIETNTPPVAAGREETVMALVHHVGSNDTGGDTTARQRFSEIQRGDVLLDFVGDVALDNKPNLRFVIDGREYVQKGVGATVAQSWDVRCDGAPIIRTVCVQPL